MGGFWNPVQLGKTELRVVPIGLAASYGIEGRGVERAFERGLNFFYWGAKFAPILPRSGDFGAVVKRLGAAHRDRIVTVIQSYSRSPEKMTRSIESGLRTLGFDYIHQSARMISVNVCKENVRDLRRRIPSRTQAERKLVQCRAQQFACTGVNQDQALPENNQVCVHRCFERRFRIGGVKKRVDVCLTGVFENVVPSKGHRAIGQSDNFCSADPEPIVATLGIVKLRTDRLCNRSSD